MDPKSFSGAKATLIIVSLLLGILTWSAGAFDILKERELVTIGGGCTSDTRQVEKLSNTLKFKPKGALRAIPFAIFVSFFYPIIAAWMIKLCGGLKVWAYRGKAEQWDDELKLLLGAFWPLTLVSCIIVYSFLGIIHRVF